MTRTIPSQVPVFSRSEERAILTVTCSAAFLFFNSFGSIGVALPAIQKQFGNSLSEIQWVTLMGVVTISSLSFCFGRAGEILGQRRLYKIGVVLYAAGAGLGAISTSFPELLLARAVMAVGLAMALPMSTALASPLAGRLADRFNAATMASIGLLTIVVGIACYSRLKKIPTIVWSSADPRRRDRYLYAGHKPLPSPQHDRHDDCRGFDGNRRRTKALD